ncbi:MAG: bifunctional 23S rRNA (guanine(2069)-N(7))-methyltransferase RlmK/23S rRNA (guanine(2445)-N(2))-methyltransferase RlmL [Myxococcales bacterium FL481]|nr:MAG: bifunctional 23S rRNA (guanine(2069)-N(7))-methyltransferase RlmK/23S rRNA (guanine(2445)-N(2))-methyltransferase RlmL [Myxococcales bacterium FL481]
MTSSFFVVAPRRVESVLAEELRELGVDKPSTFATGVRVAGDLELAYRICLWARVASRVLLHLGDLAAADADALYRAARAIDWSEHLAPTGTFAVDCTTRHAAIGHSHYAALRLKDAIVDRYRAEHGERPSVAVERPQVQLRLHLEGAVGRVYLDLAGESLHRRGYREASGVAPLKENLAAAVLRRARWPEAAAEGWRLLDPMCGSGTLLVEAAWMATDRAPGLEREYFGFLGWRGHQATLWSQLLAEARARFAEGSRRPVEILGRDVDERAVELARDNVRRAGAETWVELEVADLVGARSPGDRGLMVVNPPYGARLGEPDAVATLFDRLGEALAGPYAGWRAAVLCGEPELSSRLRRRIRRRHRFYNGSLDIELLSIEPRADEEDVRSLPTAAEVDVAPFVNRLRKNLKRLAAWREREQISCFRVYDADIPEFAVAVDVYEDWAHVQEYAPPRSIEPAWARARLEAVRLAVPDALGIAPEHVVTKTRARQRGNEQYVRLGATARTIVVREGPARFLVNLHDYLDAGLFLDHRPTRHRLMGGAPDRVLNLFCYTGSLTVAAALGGARSSISVDTSATYLRWAADNFELNRLPRPAHRLVRGDVWAWLEQYDGATFDLVLCDPPTFSNSKSRAQDFEVGRDHVRLVEMIMPHVSRGGALWFSSNKRGFALADEVGERFAVASVGARSVPPDFGRSVPHRQWEIRWPEAADEARRG